VKHIVLLIFLLALQACASAPKCPITEVPVLRRAEAPDELKAGMKRTTPPTFVIPADPRSSSCLTPEGEKQLRELSLNLLTQLCAWEAWGAIPVTGYCKSLRTQKIAQILEEHDGGD
jgi:hypothetical protein